MVSYLKNFIKGGLLVLVLNFIVLNALTLYYDMSQIDIDIKWSISNILLASILRTPNEFSYEFMGGGIFLSILIGGIIALLITIIFQNKKSTINS